MPIIIDKQNYKLWLDKQTSQNMTQQLLEKDAYQEMVSKPISDYVNNPYHNDKDCLN